MLKFEFKLGNFRLMAKYVDFCRQYKWDGGSTRISCKFNDFLHINSSCANKILLIKVNCRGKTCLGKTYWI